MGAHVDSSFEVVTLQGELVRATLLDAAADTDILHGLEEQRRPGDIFPVAGRNRAMTWSTFSCRSLAPLPTGLSVANIWAEYVRTRGRLLKANTVVDGLVLGDDGREFFERTATWPGTKRVLVGLERPLKVGPVSCCREKVPWGS